MARLRIVPLGDQSVLAYAANESAAVRLAAAIRWADWPWLLDVVPAYASVGIHFDADRITYAEVARALHGLKVGPASAKSGARRYVIPCCYELGPDFEHVAKSKKLKPEKVIELHTGQDFSVYAVGFAPGFPYLGYLPAELTGVPRLASPRVRVPPGSVGLTGRQTGIYPLERPGGWSLIGRTPLTLVDIADGFFPLRVGDTVRFERIDEARYGELAGKRLTVAEPSAPASV